MEIIEKALIFASQAHDGQFRKSTRIPYISHPAAVGMMLLKEGCRDEVVAAGLLHDTVEDTGATLEEISEQFGENVASIVEGCSEPDKTLSWESRKEHTIQFLKNASEDIRVVACADKLHNLRSISIDQMEEGEAVWERFNRGRDKQEWYYRSLADSLGHQSAFPLLDELKKEIGKLFGGEGPTAK
ncbi:HD domain-containing protein [Bacillus sp. FJAT-27251]|uniref:HD domain-containing protein n=1 Tax=Bacillus sp. FJAT-27251 TaxID=1684142 RepID=UPI0006A75BED|nr:HD domain-containing protein [Bacillus sp. FJAT-27251]